MALIYTAQPVTGSQKKATAYHGEIDKYGNWFIIDANGKEVAYFRLAKGLPATIQARVAEMATIVAAVVVAINTL